VVELHVVIYTDRGRSLSRQVRCTACPEDECGHLRHRRHLLAVPSVARVPDTCIHAAPSPHLPSRYPAPGEPLLTRLGDRFRWRRRPGGHCRIVGLHKPRSANQRPVKTWLLPGVNHCVQSVVAVTGHRRIGRITT
jgi:hypothetical protein